MALEQRHLLGSGEPTPVRKTCIGEQPARARGGQRRTTALCSTLSRILRPSPTGQFACRCEQMAEGHGEEEENPAAQRHEAGVYEPEERPSERLQETSQTAHRHVRE